MALKEFMTRGERGVGKAEQASPQLAASAPPRTVSPTTSIDANSEFQGTLRCKETLRIDGRVEGTVECEKAVLVGEGAKIQASVTADEVRVSGVVHGDIVARRKIMLARTAVVIGDLTTPGIVIEEGAKLKGRIVIGSDVEPVRDEMPASELKNNPARKKTATSPAPAKREEVPVAASA
jgi:cytoskeletal protein CcmA (bactofilin family)